MDKRTVTFIISLSLAFFAVKLFFHEQDLEKQKKWQQERLAKENRQREIQEQAVRERIASKEDLPIGMCLEKNKAAAQGISLLIGDIALVWKSPLFPSQWPESLFISSANANEFKNKAYSYASSTTQAPFALYTTSSRPSSSLKIAQLPSQGLFDLQLISFKVDDNNQSAEAIITLGQYIDGNFHILGEVPSSNAIALIKTENGYLPTGFYIKDKNQWIALEKQSVFSTSQRFSGVQLVSLEEPSSTPSSKEKYYVLENQTLQLVFSNKGGAITEINLPFHTEEDQQSVVLPIEFDRELQAIDQKNASFPLHKAATFDGSVQPQQLGGYYPLLRRDRLADVGQKPYSLPARYYALNIVSEYPELAELTYQVKHFTATQIVFEAKQPHRRITKTFTLSDASGAELPYCFDVEIKIEGDSRNLWLTSGVPEIEWISGAPAPALKYRITRNGKPEIVKVDLPTQSMTTSSITPDWICDSNGFFGLIIDPITEVGSGFKVQRVSGLETPSRLIDIDRQHQRFKPQDLPGFEILLPLKTIGTTTKLRIFSGPFAEDVLKQVDQATSTLEGQISKDYIGCQTFHGWFAFISEPFAKMLLFLMKYFHAWTGSWALSIVFITIVLRVLLYPLNAWSMRSMRQMQLIGPQIKAIQEKYKKDPQKAQLEIVSLYRERGVNPLSGCLPMLLQMPFLIGMFDLLKSTFELRGAPFIPGWIDNLTAPDVLFRWNFSIPFIGNEFHLLPILLGLIMFVQQQMQSNLPKDSSLWTEQQRQQRAMGNIMAVVFTVMFYNFPSGLNIYWLSSMLLGIIQQWYTNRQLSAQSSANQSQLLPKKTGKS